MENLVHDNDFFRKGFINAIIIGKSQCGKSYLLKQLIDRFSKNIKTAIIATSVDGVDHHKEILEKFARKGCQVAKYLTPDNLMKAIQKCYDQQIVSPTRPGVIMFDDFTDITTARGPCFNTMAFAATKLRNQGWHVVFITQDITRLPIPVRNSSTCQIFFDSYSRSNIHNFLKDITDRVAAPEYMDLIIRYIRNEPFRYILCRQYPFDICVGKGLEYKKVMSESSVEIPTLKDIKEELGVKSIPELKKKSAYLQKGAGNNSRTLDSIIGRF
jgi:hypothetical protein